MISRIAHHLKGARLTGIYGLGREALLYRWPKQRDIVLGYHSILPQENSSLSVRNHGVSTLRIHLQRWKKHHQFVSLTEMLTQPSSARRIALTFDDGLLNNLLYALPVLEDEQVPASFFVSTPQLMARSILWPDLLSQWAKTEIQLDYLGQHFYRSSHGTFRSVKGELLTDALMKLPKEELLTWLEATERRCGPAHSPCEAEWRIMNSQELQQLAKSPLVEIGSHGISHASFRVLTQEELTRELCESKTYLEKTIGKAVSSVAFPFGQYNEAVLAQAEAAGYSYLVGVEAKGSGHSKVIYRTGLDNLHRPLHSIDKVHRLLEKPFTFHP